jgi:hypothetical protein
MEGLRDDGYEAQRPSSAGGATGAPVVMLDEAVVPLGLAADERGFA